MTDISMEAGVAPRQRRARNWLDLSAKIWFVVTAIGQWLFVFYINGFFGSRFIARGVDGFEGTHLPNGYVPGDDVGNSALALHVLAGGLIIAAGQIQLIPAIRAHLPRLHRYSGWFYMMASVAVSVAGMYLVWTRDRQIGSLIQDIGTTGSGVLVMLFVPLALYYAITRNFAAHRRWALRLFMVVSAVWFLRLLIFGWLMLTGGYGMDFNTFTGPFLYFAGFAQYLLPLAVLELYFWAQKPKNKAWRGAVAGVITVFSAYMAVGIFAITMGFWIPRVLH